MNTDRGKCLHREWNSKEDLQMGRVYNFSAGPAVLPEEVLKEAAEEMLDYKGTGMSVMEMSHRSKAYDTIIKEAEQDLRDLMNIPDNYKVLFLQGGASQQFAAVPMNLMKNKVADYIIDMGPEGGSEGGQVIATGTPEEVSKVADSYTGKFLKPLLSTK